MSVFDYRDGEVIAGKIAFNARADEYTARTQNSKDQLLWVLAAVYAVGMLLMFILW